MPTSLLQKLILEVSELMEIGLDDPPARIRLQRFDDDHLVLELVGLNYSFTTTPFPDTMFDRI